MSPHRNPAIPTTNISSYEKPASSCVRRSPAATRTMPARIAPGLGRGAGAADRGVWATASNFVGWDRRPSAGRGGETIFARQAPSRLIDPAVRARVIGAILRAVALRFELIHTDRETGGRAGLLHTPHGTVGTPAFMPVGTHGTVRALTPEEVESTGAQIVLANTFHLALRPGVEVIARAGGLHAFMHWERPLLTDSGGYQVFSLAHLRRVADEGVWFRSPIDGADVAFTPERVIEIEARLGADIIMPLDVCLG